MNTVQQLLRQSLAVLVLLASASPAGAGVRHPAPGASGDISHQQSSDQIEEEEYLEEEPDCD